MTTEEIRAYFEAEVARFIGVDTRTARGQA
jgi:hypothetical protein